jgi:hypothetical protein
MAGKPCSFFKNDRHPGIAVSELSSQELPVGLRRVFGLELLEIQYVGCFIAAVFELELCELRAFSPPAPGKISSSDKFVKIRNLMEI